MEWIIGRPPRVGVKVHFEAREGGAPTSGSYTVVENDEYNMAGHVVIESRGGDRYGVNAEQLEIIELHPDFLAIKLPPGYDGLTFLPSEEDLRGYGFTDHDPEKWYYTLRVGSAESLNITIPKVPVGEVLGEPVYGYTELVMDEYFGQPAYFGRMREEFRYSVAEEVSGILRTLLPLGLRIEVDPIEYGWADWPQDRPLTGLNTDGATLSYLRGQQIAPKGQEEAVAPVLSAPEPAIEVSLDPELLVQVAAAIDREAKNFGYDSLAHDMTMGEYVAPTALRVYLAGIQKKQDKDETNG